MDAVHWMALSRYGVEHFVHVGGVHIRINNHDIVRKQTGFGRPNSVRNPSGEVNEWHLSRNHRHVTDAVGWTEHPCYRKIEFFEFRINLSTLYESGCRLPFVHRHPHIRKRQDWVITISNRVYLQD